MLHHCISCIRLVRLEVKLIRNGVVFDRQIDIQFNYINYKYEVEIKSRIMIAFITFWVIGPKTSWPCSLQMYIDHTFLP